MSATPFCGVVLAGGRSRRMGQNKALLSAGEETFLEHALNRYRSLTGCILLSVGRDTHYRDCGVPLVFDNDPEGGALAGIEACLSRGETDDALFFFLPVDMPLAPVELIRDMVELAEGYDAVVPLVDGYYEPLFAVYRKTCLEPVRRALIRGDRRVRSFFPDVRICTPGGDYLSGYGDPERMFLNVNTMEDYLRYRKVDSHE